MEDGRLKRTVNRLRRRRAMVYNECHGEDSAHTLRRGGLRRNTQGECLVRYRTAKIRDLEATRYAVFLRPRRFGKSLLTSILEAYYDVACAGRFEALFGGTDIGDDPTDERNSYLVLSFDFSAVEKAPGNAEESFSTHVCGRIDAFARKLCGPHRRSRRVQDIRCHELDG